MKTLKQILFALLVLSCLFFFKIVNVKSYSGTGEDYLVTDGYALLADSLPCERFYDGEGNLIPLQVVNLLVRSQYVVMSKEEIDTLHNYFYFLNY